MIQQGIKAMMCQIINVQEEYNNRQYQVIADSLSTRGEV